MKVLDKIQHLVLEKETIEWYGYRSSDLSTGSPRKVIHKCDVCGKPKHTAYRRLCLDKGWAHNECGQVKKKQTMLKKYGVEYSGQSSELMQKKAQTCLQRYGVKNPQQSSSVKYKTKQTNLKKYGVSSPTLVPEILEKQKETRFRRYGVRHIWQLPAKRRQHGQICYDRYGAECWAQLPENRDKLKRWCTDNPEKRFTSTIEQELLSWVQIYYPDAKKHWNGGHEIDIYIPSINVGLELNGLFYHQESIVGKKYHLNKTQYFNLKGIRIIHIFEHEWRWRQEQVKSFLLSAIHKNAQRIGARKCNVVWTSSKKDIEEVHQFIDNYHIQGMPHNTRFAIKVLYNNQLVAAATFGKHHRNNKSWVLTRFCTKTDITIQGILSKISHLASQQLKSDIISWADFRLSNGNGYERAGWILEETLPPDYFYFSTSGRVFSKQSRQKKLACTPRGMTEYEHAQQDNLARVWDCGKMRYKYQYNGNLLTQEDTLG